MGKKILYIVLGALVVFGLLFLLWSLFFGGSKTPTGTGTLGSAGNITQTPAGGTEQNNNQIPFGTNTNGTQIINGQQNTSGSVTQGTAGSGATLGGGGGSETTFGLTNVPGVTWLGSPFNPADINSVSPGAGGFVPKITSQPGGSGSNNMLTILAGTAIAGTISCALQAGLATGSSGAATAASSGGAGVVAAGIVAPFGTSPGANITADFGIRKILATQYGLQTAQAARSGGKDQITFLGCITNVVAKTALRQITISVVNWINSGFKGSPSFVTNFQQFFTNVADAAAGQFIQGAGLSFLCTPFRLQIKIAIAQSYANRSAQSCTLTRVIGNVNSFMNGNFAQGGWGGLVSFTTMPTNNPYGAFAYAQVGLASAQQTALSNANRNISPTGFLNLQQLSGCTDSANNGIAGGVGLGINSQAAIAGGAASLPDGCKPKVVTPGGVIAESLGAVNKSGIDQLGLASNIDQIINALTTQLMVKLLQNGLPSLSQATTQTPADIAAQSQALGLLNDMQSRSTFAQQLGSIYQGSISDIESVQAGLSGLANCWSSVASSTNDATAVQNAASARATIQSLESQVTGFNNAITQINSSIVGLNQFESDVSTASTAANIATITTRYNAAVAAGTFPSQTEVTTAQQNRTTLQSQLAAINQSTQSGLAQCSVAGGY
jgi:hypothetical protein